MFSSKAYYTILPYIKEGILLKVIVDGLKNFENFGKTAKILFRDISISF